MSVITFEDVDNAIQNIKDANSKIRNDEYKWFEAKYRPQLEEGLRSLKQTILEHTSNGIRTFDWLCFEDAKYEDPHLLRYINECNRRICDRRVDVNLTWKNTKICHTSKYLRRKTYKTKTCHVFTITIYDSVDHRKQVLEDKAKTQYYEDIVALACK